MEIKERDIQNFILDKHKNNTLSNYGLKLLDNALYSELDLKSFGRLDLLALERQVELDKMRDEMSENLYLEVIEIKKGALNLKSLEQICRYGIGVQQSYYLDVSGHPVYLSKDLGTVHMSYILIGSHISLDLSVVLRCFPSIDVYLYTEHEGNFYFKLHDNSPSLFLDNNIKLSL